LKADTLKMGSVCAKDEQALEQVGKYLRTEKIPRLVSLLNSLTVMPMDSEQL
jgi:hypothetical protein